MTEVKNILFTHAYSKHNKGDAAIVSTQIKIFKNIFPNTTISILTMEGVDSGVAFEGIAQYNSFFYQAIYSTKNSVFRILKTLFLISTTSVWALLYRLGIDIKIVLPKTWYEICFLYAKADLVVPVGGGYLFSKKGFKSFISLLLHLHAIWIALFLRKRVILFSQSIGPFSNSFHAMLVRKTLNKVNKVMLREAISYETLKEMGVIESKMLKAPDAAFFFENQNKAYIKNELEILGVKGAKPIIGITVRDWLSEQDQKQYENAIADLIRYIVLEKNMSVLLIPQVTATFHNDDDRLVNDRIYTLCDGLANVYKLEKDYDFKEIKSVIENLDFLVGTRMHSVIFGLTSYVPSIAIAYEYKTTGIMVDLGLDNWVIEIEQVNSQILKEKVEQLIDHKDDYVHHIKNKLPLYVEQFKLIESELSNS